MVETLSQIETSVIGPATWIAPMKNGTSYLANRPECAIDLHRGIFLTTKIQNLFAGGPNNFTALVGKRLSVRIGPLIPLSIFLNKFSPSQLEQTHDTA